MFHVLTSLNGICKDLGDKYGISYSGLDDYVNLNKDPRIQLVTLRRKDSLWTRRKKYNEVHCEIWALLASINNKLSKLEDVEKVIPH